MEGDGIFGVGWGCGMGGDYVACVCVYVVLNREL
jgi:hypothetical protein